MTRDEKIMQLWMRSKGGFSKEDIERAFAAGEESARGEPPAAERLLVGDYFRHVRTGSNFVCTAVSKRDFGGRVIQTAEVVPIYGQPR